MDVMSGINVATTAAMTVSVVRMTGTIADRMEILTAAGVTRDRIGGTRARKEINRQSKKTNISNE